MHGIYSRASSRPKSKRIKVNRNFLINRMIYCWWPTRPVMTSDTRSYRRNRKWAKKYKKPKQTKNCGTAKFKLNTNFLFRVLLLPCQSQFRVCLICWRLPDLIKIIVCAPPRTGSAAKTGRKLSTRGAELQFLGLNRKFISGTDTKRWGLCVRFCGWHRRLTSNIHPATHSVLQGD